MECLRINDQQLTMDNETNPRTIGAAPVGAQDRDSAAKAVREMFTSIAPRYDLLNHVLSCNIDRLWWWRTARSFDAILKRPGTRILDLCCGTGDMTFALNRRAASGSAQILGADFSHAMLQRAAEKGRGTGLRWIEADALGLPFRDEYFGLVTSAFGFRNLADYDAGLREIARVLAPGGECGILDFGEPGGLIRQLELFCQEFAARIPICPRRSNAFLVPMRCSDGCDRLDFARLRGLHITSGSPDFTGEGNRVSRPVEVSLKQWRMNLRRPLH
jgi:demethylmenaquinone methyltransferase/2-methoxy-6-polyprenyl-1,4-benzoquinol methylase